MTYTDEDILDLYEDLLDIGLAETPEEEADRAYSLLVGRITTSQASQILTDTKIPHTFYTALLEDDAGDNYRTNWILVRGLTVFCDNGYMRQRLQGRRIRNSLSDFKEAIQDFNYILISEVHFTDASLLSKAGQIRSIPRDPAAPESIHP
jgi:hypothetical protein